MGTKTMPSRSLMHAKEPSKQVAIITVRMLAENDDKIPFTGTRYEFFAWLREEYKNLFSDAEWTAAIQSPIGRLRAKLNAELAEPSIDDSNSDSLQQVSREAKEEIPSLIAKIERRYLKARIERLEKVLRETHQRLLDLGPIIDMQDDFMDRAYDYANRMAEIGESLYAELERRTPPKRNIERNAEIARLRDEKRKTWPEIRTIMLAHPTWKLNQNGKPIDINVIRQGYYAHLEQTRCEGL
jgi:hypothetical protein